MAAPERGEPLENVARLGLRSAAGPRRVAAQDRRWHHELDRAFAELVGCPARPGDRLTLVARGSGGVTSTPLTAGRARRARG